MSPRPATAPPEDEAEAPARRTEPGGEQRTAAITRKSEAETPAERTEHGMGPAVAREDEAEAPARRTEPAVGQRRKAEPQAATIDRATRGPDTAHHLRGQGRTGAAGAKAADTHAAYRVSRGPVDPRLLRHARASRAGIGLLALIGAGQAAATIAIAVALCAIVTGLASGRSVAVFPEALTGTAAILLLAAAFTARGGLAWAEQVVAQRTAAKVTDELRRSLLDRVIGRGPAWVAAYGSGRLTTVLGSGLDALRPWFSGYLPALVLGVVLPPLVVVIMAVVDPASAVIALLTLPLLPILGALIGWATKARAERRWAADARLAGHFLDVVRGLATLKMYGRAERQIDVIADLTDRHRAATMRVLRVAFLSSTALDLVGTLAVGLIAVQAGLRVAGGAMELGPALLVILLAPEAYRPLREMAARYHASTDAGAVIADVDDILSPPATSEAPQAGSLDHSATSAWNSGLPAPSEAPQTGGSGVSTGDSGPVVGALIGIHSGNREARDLAPQSAGHAGMSVAEGGPGSAIGDRHTAPQGFRWQDTGRWGVRAAGIRARYPGAFTDALRLPELFVHAGELVALRGPSGAGKTTALRVLAGLHPAESGALAVGSTFYLPQRSALPHARTVGEAFPADAAPADIRAALHAVGLTGEVTPETPLGEQVSGVSAGQRQRLAFAVLLHRATHALSARRPSPRLVGASDGRLASRFPQPVVTLLLDEPTAHLDVTAERLIIARLRDLASRGCAVLVVAHRPALLAAADRIVEVAAPASPAPLTSTVTAATPNEAEQPSWMADPSPAAPAHPAAPSFSTPTPGGTPAAHASTAISHQGGDARDSGGAEEAKGRGHDSGAGRWDGMRRPGIAAALGAGSSLAGILLTGSAAWLLVRASSLPPVLSLSAAVVLVRGSAVARPLLRYLERLLAHDVAFARLGARRAQVYATLIPHVPGPRLHRRGDLLTRLVDDVDARVDGLLRGRLPMIAGAVTAVVCMLAVAWAAPELAVPVAVGLLVAGVLAPAIAARQVDRQEAATGAARSALRDAVVETVDGVEELSGGSGRQGVPQERSRTLAKLEARAAREAGLAAATAHLGWGAAAAGVAVLLGRTGLSAEWSAVVLLGVIVLGETVVGLPEAAIARRRAAGAESRVSKLTAARPPINTNVNTAANPVNMTSQHINTDDRVGGDADRVSPERGGVRVSGLVAGWDPGRAPVLDGLDLRLPAGSRTVVTGRSGSGKSTLAAVLAGLLEPRAGTVSGHHGAGGPTVLVGDETGHVFESSVRENLRLGAPGADDERLVAVLERVGLGAWLAGLPEGLDTWLGTGGSTVSGGQRRRIATARALLADPALLILDEPTEGIDEDGANQLMADLLGAADGRTVLVFAHRAEGFRLADRVLSLSQGKLTDISL